MKRVRSIFGIFTVFLLIILASFLLLSWQSTANLKASLIQTAQLQTKYAATLLEQKGKEIEIEADGILYGENMQNLYAAIENNDVYEYVQQINKMKSFFQERQGRTGGMSGMTLYWPKSGREISTLRQVRNIMTISGIMLGAILIFGMIYISLFVKNILMQMNLLTEKLKQVEVGDLTVQIYKMPKNEFAYVFRQFNHMVRRTHELLEATVKEQELRNEAEMRQLQLQINPHFLYNSLSFIVTAADNPDAVTEMAVHLSQYYRYCTRKKSITTIQEEIDYARSYLEIMAMRKNIEYEIESDPELAACKIPPLILQPIIENAIEHAIEERENAKHIYVKVYQKVKDEICFEISDDGNGLTEEQIAALKERLARKNRDEKEGVGLWNVNQRLVNYYGEQSSLQFGGSIWKGLCVSFVIDGKERL